MAAQQDFWGQFEVVEYDKPQYDWGQFEQVPQNKHALETSLKELPENDPYVKTQKHQTEQLANMLFTAEERKAIENKGEIGWWEYAKNYADLSEAVPFYGTGKQIAQTSKVYSIAKKLENGEEVTAADKSYMQDYLKKYTETQLRGTSWGAKGASMLIQAPAFIGEFIATAGVGATAGKGAIIAGVKGAGAAATKAAIKAGTKVATSKALSTIAGEQAVKTIGTKAALETSAKLAGKAATQQAVLVPMYAVQNYNEKKIADGLNLTDKGSDVLYNTQKADSSASWAKSFGIGEIEILSEMSGGLLGYMAGGVTRGITTAATKIGGKVATTNVVRGISAVSAKVYNSIPKEARIKLEAAARLTDKLGKKLNTVSEKLKQPSIGFHGVAEEMGEERLGDVLKYAFDLDEKEGYLDENGNFDFEQLGSAIFPGWQQLLLEAGVFSIVGGGSFATRTVINNLKEKGYSDKEATTISQNLSEIEKENMANEILGEVKINEDIKEQEVIKEQVKIENAMLKGGISITENAQENTTEKQKPKTLSDYKKDILSNKFEEGKIDTIKHKYNGRVINQVFKSKDNDFRYANREFNKIINDIYKNPSIIDNKEEYDNLETQLESVINSLPYNDKEEVVYPYYEKFYNAVNSAGEYLEAKKEKTKAAELYDMADTAGATPSQEEEAKKEWEEKGTDSRFFKKWFGDSKVVDENGKPLVVYHGTNANFDTFDKNKISENTGNFGHLGNGFYFSIDTREAETYGDNILSAYLKIEKPFYATDKQLEEFSEILDLPVYETVNKDTFLQILKSKDKKAYKLANLLFENEYTNAWDKFLASENANDNVYNLDEISNIVEDIKENNLTEWTKNKIKELFPKLKIETKPTAKNKSLSFLLNLGQYKSQVEEFTNAVKNKGYDGIIYGSEIVAFEPTQIKSVDNQGTFDENNPNIYYDVEEEAPKKQPKTLKEVEEIADKEAEKAEEKRGFKELYGDFKDAFSNFIEPFYAGAVDRLAPIQNTVKKANKKGAEIGIELGDKNWSENPYYMARMYSGLANRIWQHFTENTMKRAEDGTQKITGEGFGKIIEDLYKETKDIESNKETQLKDFEDYLIAKRFLLDLKDREGYEATEEQKLKAVQDMARLAEKYGEDMTTLEKLADRVYEYNRRTLHLLVDSGNMSQETYDKIIEQNPHHISYKRVMDDNYGTNGLSFAKGKFTDAKSPIKKIRGSEREIQSIYKSTLEDTMRIIDVAERNRIASKVAALKEYLPEDIKSIKPKMEKRTAKVKVTYDAKMRSQLEEAIKFFGRTFKNVKSIKTPQGYALGSYSEEEKEVRKKLGSQDRTLAHEVGHMLDFALDVENQIKNDSKIMQEIKTLAEDRFKSTVKLQDGEFITEDAGSTEKYKNYVQSNKEAIANAFDLYFTSRDYVKRVAPETAKFIDNLFKGEYAFLNEIRPSSETATEEIEQDVWTPSNRKPSDNSIGYYENGKIKFVEVNPNVMEAVNDLSVNPKQMGKIISAVDAVLSRSSALLRTGATLNPEFILRNPIRDIQEAWFNIDGFNPIIDVPKGLLAVIGKKNSKLYKEWQREGGSFNSYMELNDKTISQALNLYKENKTIIGKIIDFVPSKIKKGLSFLEAISSTLEETTRLGIYNAMLRKGLSPSQAAFMSREGTLDFSRMGKDVRILNRWKAFLNASIQGSDRVVRTILADPKTALIKGMQMAAFQALLSGYYLYQAPDDEREEYLEIPDWQKKLFFLFKFGGRWWKIPRAFAPGFLFQATTENFMIWAATKEKPEGLELFNFAKGLFEATSPITDISSVLTPLVQIALENTVNYNFFTKQRLYPEYLNDYEPSERYTKKTSETAKLLGEKLNISPAKIENALRGQLGNLARYGTDLGDLMINTIKKAIGEEVNEKPDDKGRYPIVRGFSVDDPIGNHSKSLNSFYETYNKLSKINNTLNKKEKENYEDAMKYEEKHLEEIEKFNLIKGSYKEITELRKEANEIYKNPSIDGKEKTDLITDIEEQMTEIAREANEKLKE